MSKSPLISATDFCALVGIQSRRFEMQRQRERARLDAAETLGTDTEQAVRLPIAPLEAGRHSRFGFLDALAMRAVMTLEAGGVDFEKACGFVRTSGLSGFVLHDPQAGDYFIARWLTPDGTLRRTFGSSIDLSRSMPSAPNLAITLNVSAIAEDVAKRASAQLGLRVERCNFVKDLVP